MKAGLKSNSKQASPTNNMRETTGTASKTGLFGDSRNQGGVGLR